MHNTPILKLEKLGKCDPRYAKIIACAPLKSDNLYSS